MASAGVIGIRAGWSSAAPSAAQIAARAVPTIRRTRGKEWEWIIYNQKDIWRCKHQIFMMISSSSSKQQEIHTSSMLHGPPHHPKHLNLHPQLVVSVAWDPITWWQIWEDPTAKSMERSVKSTFTNHSNRHQIMVWDPLIQLFFQLFCSRKDTMW